MTPDDVKKAAAMLVRARDAGGEVPRLPADLRPVTMQEGYAIQDEVIRQRAASGMEQAGWKVGCTSKVMQEMLGLDVPGGGAVLAANHLITPARQAASGLTNPVAECEIAVRIGQDLEPREGGHDRTTVAHCVESCMAAIELAELRHPEHADMAPAEKVADDFFQRLIVTGKEVTEWQALDLAALRATTTVSGVARGEGYGEASLGHPLNTVAWLANCLAERGTRLLAGHVVLTGSLVEAVLVEEGDDILCAVEDLGEVRLTMV
ncbi:MAG: fumarylacetoacetate hydrolase family protein [bacterium]|nr:fumarylacetoacetate hydrolase family protein [bacterium]MDE0418614.1 fumarylacetoacetate hydrolase family protein [bacterium]